MYVKSNFMQFFMSAHPKNVSYSIL